MAKVTDQLLRAAAAAAQGDRVGALAISSRLRSRHRDTAAELVKAPSVAADLIAFIDEKFDSLDEVLRAWRPSSNSPPHLRPDRQLWRAHLQPHRRSRLQRAGHRLRPRGRARDRHYRFAVPEGRPKDAIIETRAQNRLLPLTGLGKVPVMGGFIASNEAGITTTLGRGGSDFTGALLGGALSARPSRYGPTWTGS